MKILEELKKNWKFYIIMTVSIILIILLMTYMVNISDKLYKKIDYKIGDSYVEDIDTDTTITQKFIAEYNNKKLQNIPGKRNEYYQACRRRL